ncbi:MAG: carbohydrate binding family 9 domain-containing protein, partial [Bacteroidia bacterium]|nr:carbohydrate binding family 9 domain-containing protein [Bacteroidia bacterium]
CWQVAEELKEFTQYFPSDSLKALGSTKMYMCYDDEALYVAAICESLSDDYAIANLKRDYGFSENDNISFIFDTFNDKTNAYMFGMNAYGARREALISNGGKTRNSFNASWDNKWDGESKIYSNYWICELKIPFKTIRYNKGASKWRFNCYRNDKQCNEITCWVNIPRENILMDLTYMTDMIWEDPLDEPGKNISAIPYTSYSNTRDFEATLQLVTDASFNIGGDAKIALSSSMNLDLTFNPDFSQVEVDQQVTNLDRFEIFFPERRQFFLENADLFSRFGNSRMNPFFSRRIGISKDTLTDTNIQNKIFYGARGSGKINETLRLGVLNMMTADQPENDLPIANYTVLAAEKQVFGRSNIAFIFTNRQSVNAENYGTTLDKYDRVAGLEYRLLSENNLWSGKASFMKALTPNDEAHKFAHYLQLEHNKRTWRVEWVQMFIGEGFDAEMGFVPRKDIIFFSPEFTYRIFPGNGKVSFHNINVDTRIIYKLGKEDNEIFQGFGREELGFELRWHTRFNNNSDIRFKCNYSDFVLLEDFDPTRIQEDEIFKSAGSKFQNLIFELSYNTDRRKRLYARVRPFVGSYYDGFRAGIATTMSYRFQPYGSISVELNYNHIKLDEPFEEANLWLIGPKLDLTFTRKLFLTSFVQYNTQFDNLNMNTRFQWRFAPVSDFFLVYTDNYDTGIPSRFQSRNRAFIAKLTYWLNL